MEVYCSNYNLSNPLQVQIIIYPQVKTTGVIDQAREIPFVRLMLFIAFSFLSNHCVTGTFMSGE